MIVRISKYRHVIFGSTTCFSFSFPFSSLGIPSEDLSILKVLYSSIGSSAVYGPRANNIGTMVLRNSSKVLTGVGAPLFLNGAYVLVLILGVRPLYLLCIGCIVV